MTNKICPECGTEHVESARFCRNCGAQFSNENNSEANAATRCRNCGAVINDEAYCPDCGNPTGIRLCPNCRQKTVNEDFCSICGYRLNQNVRICGNCGEKIDARAKVCAHCGANVAQKNGIVALVLSFVFPGLGQIYNGQTRKGLILIASYVIAWILCLILIGAILAFVIWIYGMYDAYSSAKAINGGEVLEDRLFGI